MSRADIQYIPLTTDPSLVGKHRCFTNGQA